MIWSQYEPDSPNDSNLFVSLLQAYMHHPMTNDFMVTDERWLVGEVKVQVASAIDGATVIGERFGVKICVKLILFPLYVSI